MEVMRSYVIRIYREDSDSLTGMLESVETGESFAFRSIEELRAVLSRPAVLRRTLHSNRTDKEREP